MVQSQFSLTWNSYKNSICSGFTALQQNGELVDMTLAADGHFVKVHQVLMALASPYLKELIASAPGQHPVLFLNNVSYKTMSLILEYIYTGEVLVPADGLNLFTEAAKGLHIKGLENITNNESLNISVAMEPSQMEETISGNVSGVKRLAIPTSDGIGQINVPAAARRIVVKNDLMPRIAKVEHNPEVSVSIPQMMQSHTLNTSQLSATDVHDYSDMMTHDDTTHDSDDDYKPGKHSNKDLKPTSNLQYTVSIRGSLQVILNRYIYNLQSTTSRSNMRRWRCIDYRNSKCMAFVVTKDNVVSNRANLHNHPFHDKKILAKINKKCVFSAIDDVQNYKQREEGKNMDSDAAMEEGEFIEDFN